MKAAIYKILTLVVVFMAFSGDVISQRDSCSTYLKSANLNYEGRYYDEAIELMGRALDKCRLNKLEKIEAHKILALCYLGIDDLENASEEAKLIVRLDPDYTPDKFRDDPDYVALFDGYVSIPSVRIGIYGGFNQVFADVSKTFSIYHGSDASDFSSYNEKIGFQLGALADINIVERLWIAGGIQFRETNYSRTLSEIDNTSVLYTERMNNFEVPISVKYVFLDGKLKPYISIGGTASYLARSISTSSRDEILDLVDRLDYRNKFMIGMNLGTGVLYKLKNLNLFADIRYTIYTENVNKEGTRYADEVNVYKYYYLDDDFKLNNLQVNLGVLFNLGYKYKHVK